MTTNLERNIFSQGESLSAVLLHQRGQGAPALREAASLLRSGKPILITGIGASFFASLPLEYALSAAGKDARAIEAGELLHYRSNAVRDSVAVLVSRSGESVEIARLLEALKGRTTIIGVSNEPQSQLARHADISIHVGSLADEIVAIQTYTGTLLTLYLLAGHITDTVEANEATAEKLLPAFATAVESHMGRLHEWDDFLNVGSPIYLLARGPSCASAHEGALLLHEVAKSPAVAMAAASFRHGPVEVVDRQFRGLIFTPHGRTQKLNLSLAADLTGFGGQVRVIGPPHPEFETSSPFCELPVVPESLAPLFEIVPVQAAALRMAELHGIRPGSFRYAPQVTVDEANFSGRCSDEK
jgi:glucosamine--fructose-6-phosphate aminotransferase (isomerizing)